MKRGQRKSLDVRLGLYFCRTGEWVRVPEVVSLRRWCSVRRRIVPVSDRLLRSIRVQQVHSSRRFGVNFLSVVINQCAVDSLIIIRDGGNCCSMNKWRTQERIRSIHAVQQMHWTIAFRLAHTSLMSLPVHEKGSLCKDSRSATVVS